MFLLKSLPAHDGDCFIIRFGEGENIKNIIVDGGRRKKVVKKLKEELKIIKQANQCVDLMILTHIDEDHIQGLIKIFEDKEIDKTIIKKVWFNSKELLSKHFIGEEQVDDKLEIHCKKDENVSFKQGILFGKLLKDLKLSSPHLIHSGQKFKIGEATLNVLSPDLESLKILFEKWDKVFPTKNSSGRPVSARNKEDYHKSIDELSKEKFIEDKAEANESSIAFSLEFNGVKLLMLGDSFPSIVGENLKKIYNKNSKIRFDVMKISHHGSKHNTNEHFLDLISCNRYLVSTNGHTHGFPNKETLVKIAMSAKQKSNKTKFYFNYPNIHEKIFDENEIKLLNIECIDKKNIKDEILEINLWKFLEN